MPVSAVGKRREAPYFIYAGIRVRNLRRSLVFYRALGFRTVSRGTMHHKGVFVWLRDPRTRYVLELNYYPPTSRFYERYVNGSELDHLGFIVRDVEPVLARLRKIGVRKPVADFIDGSIRLTFIKDPDGIWVEFLSWPVPKLKLKRNAPLIDLVLGKS